MLSDEVVASVARFFDRRGPSHDEITRQFARASLDRFDPAQKSRDPIGKMKRVREVLSRAIDVDPASGAKLVRALIECVKASGGFRVTSSEYAGEEVIEAARDAFRAVGYELDREGGLRPLLLENLDDVQATEALWAYVRRARVGADDAALVVGTGKDLLEACARHVLVRATGGYNASDNFPATLYQAFDRLRLATSFDMLKLLDVDPGRAMEQSLYLLGNAVNRLRNAEGTGHGRPSPSEVSNAQARVAIQAMGLISQMLLDRAAGESAQGGS